LPAGLFSTDTPIGDGAAAARFSSFQHNDVLINVLKLFCSPLTCEISSAIIDAKPCGMMRA
jgi:hypothetical protein